MSQPAIAARPALRFVIPAEAAFIRIPYFPQGIAAGFPSIVVAIVNGEFTVKRLYKRNGEIRLVPENKAFPAIEVTEGMDVEIWGVVSHIIHKAT